LLFQQCGGEEAKRKKGGKKKKGKRMKKGEIVAPTSIMFARKLGRKRRKRLREKEKKKR